MDDKPVIRKATLTDMAAIMKVMAAAKTIMRQSGNMHQWGGGYPSEAVIRADIERDGGFVLEADGASKAGNTAGPCRRIVGYFAFLPSPEPTYDTIYEGGWLDDKQAGRAVDAADIAPCKGDQAMLWQQHVGFINFYF